MNILLSIKPEFSTKILSGEKRYEFRKQVPKTSIDRVFIYESSPTQNIVGWFDVMEIMEGHPDSIWKKCNGDGGIDKTRFFRYCNGNSKVYAYSIKDVHRFPVPIDPYALDEGFTPPQNFAYIEPDSVLHQ